MSCHQSNYTLQVSPTAPIDPQDLSFESASSITVTFSPPTDHRITGIAYTPTNGTPTPSVGADSITFYDPSGGTTDFDVNITYVEEAAVDVHIMEGPTTTVKFKPRTTCPT